MRRLGLVLACWVAAASLGPAAAAGRPAVSGEFPALLRAELADGLIDRATADLYWLYAVRSPEKLPARYLLEQASAPGAAPRAAAPQPLMLRCATPFLRGVAGRLSAMPPTLRPEARRLLQVRFEKEGGAGRRAGRTAARDSVIGVVQSTHFVLAWDPDTVTNPDGTVPASDSNGDGIPDTVQLWADYLEASYSQVARILSPGTPEAAYEGTVLEDERIAVGVENLGSGTYGVTFALADEATGELLAPAMVLNTNLSFAPENDVGAATGSALANAQGAMAVTAAHEFFHAVQFVYYGADRLFDPAFSDDWWMEESSTWMEDEVFDQVNDYIQFFVGPCSDREGEGSSGSDGWASFVEEGLVIDVTTASACQTYGGVIFPKHLSEHVAGQPSMGQVWSLIRGDPPAQPGLFALEALDSFGQQVGFTGQDGTLPGLDGLYLGFAGSNASLEAEYEEGPKGYGEVPIRGTFPAAAINADLPQLLGSTYREAAADVKGAAVEVRIADSDPLEDWGLSVAVQRGGQDFRMVLAASGLQGGPSVSLGFLGAADLATAAASFFSSPSRSFSLATATPAAPDLAAPTPPTGLQAVLPDPDPGGALDVSWTPPEGIADVAGYVVRVTDTATQGADFSRSRAVLHPIREAAVRELPAGTYDVEVVAYDTSGNQSAPNPRVTGPEVGGAVPTATPAVALEVVREGISSDEVEDRKDGTRGIGTDYGLDKICFLRALGL